VTSRYYYLIASLPALVFSLPAAMSRAGFVAECERQLEPADLAEVSALLDGRLDDVRTAFSRAWLHADRQIRNAVVRARALRLGVDEKKFLQDHEGFRVDAEAAVNDAFSRANPLERELALDRYRWNLADELGSGDPFALPALLAYGVKLALNEHWRALTPEAGRERFEAMVDTVGISAQEVSAWSGLSQV
jgi:hypothetical protein